ncbi:MAG TPA: hypothetical protein VM369_11980 [Candidatus Binatia bacterium]|nr:hypothetical protein [Candidatus Binatia bacterium]
MSAPLFLPRRLAIRLLAEAQRSGEVQGSIGARGGEPCSVHAGALPEGETLWARYRSAHATSAPGAPRELVVSLDTKGVLQLRCVEGGAERELKIRD